MPARCCSRLATTSAVHVLVGIRRNRQRRTSNLTIARAKEMVGKTTAIRSSL